jgi:hypothetical protein
MNSWFLCLFPCGKQKMLEVMGFASDRKCLSSDGDSKLEGL